MCRTKGLHFVRCIQLLDLMQMEFTVASPKNISKDAVARPQPMLRIAALTVKTVPDVAGKVQEVIAASVVHGTVRADAPTPLEGWRACRGLQRFTAVRKLEGTAWPAGLEAALQVCSLCFDPPCLAVPAPFDSAHRHMLLLTHRRSAQ